MVNRGFFWDVESESWTRLRFDGFPCGICGLLDCVCQWELVELLQESTRSLSRRAHLPVLRTQTLEEPQEPESPSPRRSQDSYPSDSPTEAAGDPYLVPEQLCCN